MELYYTTDILKHCLLLFLCKVDFLTITIKSSMFPSFLCTCCFIDFKQNVTQKMSPPVAGFVVCLITQCKKKEQALLSKLKRLKIVSFYSDLLIYGNLRGGDSLIKVGTDVRAQTLGISGVNFCPCIRFCELNFVQALVFGTC